jgi:hypothetical protein
MRKEPVDDLRLLFLELIAKQHPAATAALFELRDAGKWMTRYRVSAEWLDLFLQTAIAEGHRIWIGSFEPLTTRPRYASKLQPPHG